MCRMLAGGIIIAGSRRSLQHVQQPSVAQLAWLYIIRQITSYTGLLQLGVKSAIDVKR